MSRTATMSRFEEPVTPVRKKMFAGLCEGCYEAVKVDDEYFNHEDDLVHNDYTCMRDYFKRKGAEFHN